ncbi:MAG: phosphoglucosamine mutase [Armatimonadetes bacterium]|nr:phosphoglucosamine mutase [Armatimonadota bacterium]
MNSLRIAIGGARGVIGESLTPDVIVNYSHAFGTYVEGGRVLISRDTRPSGQMVHHCVLAGLLAAGCEVVDLGVCPTPALQLAVRTSDAVGGIAITAGHNPTEWNALKPIRADGIFLNSAQAGELLDIYHQRDFRKATWDALKPYSHDVVAGLQHLDAIAAELDTDLIRSRNLLVAVDCVNGACSEYAPGLLERIGCRVVAMNTETDQPFPHQPEPAAENLSQLRALVQATGADAGFAFDADGDRLGVVCEDGSAPGEEMTICLATEMILSRGDPGPVVVNLCTTQAVEDIAAAHGDREVIRTGIGQAYVSEQALNSRACVAGEGSGGCLFPRINYANDSLATMGHILQLVAGRTSLREVVASLPRYAMTKAALPCRTHNAFSALERLREEGEPAWADPAQTELADGIKYRNRDRWVYVRVSATEPLIRVIAEAPTQGESEWLVREFLSAIRRLI